MDRHLFPDVEQTSYKNAINKMARKIDVLDDEVKFLIEKRGVLKEDVKKLKEITKNLGDSVEELQGEYEDLVKADDAIKDDIATKYEEYLTMVGTINDQLTNLKEAVNTVEGEYDELVKADSDIMDEITALAKESEEADNDILKQVSDLESDVEKSISSITTDIEKLQLYEQNNETAIADLKEEVNENLKYTLFRVSLYDLESYRLAPNGGCVRAICTLPSGYKFLSVRGFSSYFVSEVDYDWYIVQDDEGRDMFVIRFTNNHTTDTLTATTANASVYVVLVKEDLVAEYDGVGYATYETN